MRNPLSGLMGLAFVLAASLCAQQTPSQAVSILKANCQACHTQANRSGGLAFDSRDDLLKGRRARTGS